MRMWVRRTVSIGVALLLCVLFGYFTARPVLGKDEVRQLASNFGFTKIPLDSTPPDAEYQRPVQPALEHIRAWISAVGAAVALTDLRGTGRPADACLVDPRDDSVTVMPVPTAGGTPYERFALRPSGLPLDS